MDDKTASDSLTPTHGTGLRVVDTAVGLASDLLATVRTIRGHRDLVEQLKRATESTALNLAEATCSHYTSANIILANPVQ